MLLPWRLHVGLGDAEPVDPVADDRDRGVERRQVGALHRREHDRRAALEVETEHGPAVAEQRGDERADDHDDRDDEQDDFPAHGSVRPCLSVVRVAGLGSVSGSMR